MKSISATDAYNHTICPTRPWLDVRGDPDRRDPASEFAEMLWAHGLNHEAAIATVVGPFTDLSKLPKAARPQATLEAMRRGDHLIYQGRLVTDGRIGEPDFLERTANGKYRPMDAKAGAGLEGEDDEVGRLKKPYAVQLAHYYAQLEELGFADSSREAAVVDGGKVRVPYPLDDLTSVRSNATWMQFYQGVAVALRESLGQASPPRPALSATCKQCHWCTFCKEQVIASDDLSRIAELGRSKRDVMVGSFGTVADLAAGNVDAYMNGPKKTVFRGIGPDTLRKFHARAVLLSTPGARPYLKADPALPVARRDILFDIEADPLRNGGFVYLHGCVERLSGIQASARFKPFVTPDISGEAEQEAFRGCWEYLKGCLPDSVIYYYAPYEKVSYRKLADRYPTVCSVEDVDEFFANPNVIDLYAVIRRCTEWPVSDMSVKTIAKHCEFNWRDSNPSGAASIQWFHDWVKTGDQAILDRITAYNEDDCLAMGVVLDGVRQMCRDSMPEALAA
jgi:uncharacterized protein